MTTAKQLLTEAAKHIGTYGDHNIYNRWYWVTYTKTYSSDPGTAWCAAFVSYVAMKTGLKCSYSASAAGFATQFERISVQKENEVRPGDIVVFNWDGRDDTSWCDHVGIVEWSSIGTDGKFGTIEGNTGNGAEGVVARVTRSNWSTYFTAFYRPKYETEAKKTVVQKAKEVVKKAVSKPKTATKLYGIDVSSNQPERICNMVKYDFAIIKASGNPHGYRWNYVNEFAERQAADVIAHKKKLGFYGFTYGRDDPREEADLLVSTVKKLGYLRKAILVIDYEAQALEKGRAWVKKYADRVKAKAGYSPVIYASGSVITSQRLFELGYPIWCANYYNGYDEIAGYDTSTMKIYQGCEKSVLWQFTSTGYLDGYDAPLDLNVFFGTADDWDKLAGVKKGTSPAAKPASTSTGNTSPSQPKPKPKPARKSVSQVAEEVLSGKWGNGEARRRNLEAAGYSYSKVQLEVNLLMVAKDVIAGEYGNGESRVAALRRAGYDPAKVQAKVNELLS